MQTKNIKIFIVDDDNLTIDLLLDPFKKSGLLNFVGRANSGEECLSRLKNKPVDVVLMDINMKGIDGIETATRLLKIKGEDAPKIIFLTVYNDEEYIEKAFQLKSSILGKNIGIDYLINSIERVYNGEIIINPNPKGITKKDNNAKLKFVLNHLLQKDQMQIAKLIRNGLTTDEIVLCLIEQTEQAQAIGKNSDFFKKKINYVNNQKKEIYKKLKLINEQINAAYLGAIMERSGLCEPLDLEVLDIVIKKIKS